LVKRRVKLKRKKVTPKFDISFIYKSVEMYRFSHKRELGKNGKLISFSKSYDKVQITILPYCIDIS